ncbi:MAG TPA: lysozyme inhibitor LprI family protein [Terriglobales bacterium]|nr:lysozyme inhibitor LprI family protein [Terriglobales bacterium]
MKAGMLAFFLLGSVASLGQTPTVPRDPCDQKNFSNRDSRDCYGREQKKVNAQIDSLVESIANEWINDAQKERKYGPVVTASMRKAAASLRQSQRSWRLYRDQYCKAVKYGYDIGSGAGTAHERCLYEVANARLRQLQTNFVTRVY